MDELSIWQRGIETAYHEAGHAVIALALEVPVKGATIVPDGDVLGSVRIGRPIGENAEARYVVQALAGPVAQHEWLARSRPRRAPDMRAFWKAQRAASDLEQLARFGLTSWRQLGPYASAAYDLVDLLWATIDGLACQLHGVDDLAGEEIEGLCRATGDWDAIKSAAEARLSALVQDLEALKDQPHTEVPTMQSVIEAKREQLAVLVAQGQAILDTHAGKRLPPEAEAEVKALLDEGEDLAEEIDILNGKGAGRVLGVPFPEGNPGTHVSVFDLEEK